MKKISLLCFTTLIAMSCVTNSIYAENTHHNLKTNELDAIIGQWNYNLVTKDGTKIKGFFQVEPSNKHSLPVVGQAYFDKGDKTYSMKNLRGVWTGHMQSDERQQRYTLPFLMHGNPIYPEKIAEAPYHGTIYFILKDNTLNGTFSDHDSREGIGGTIIAQKHQSS